MQITRLLKHHTSLPRYDVHNALSQVFELGNVVTTRGALSAHNFAAKENICSLKGNTTCCSEVLGATSGNPYRSPFDATCVRLLQDAGANLLAKTNMDEFGMGSFTTNSPYGATMNPHDPLRTAGGSSGGSAASLALPQTHSLSFALGTDTGGSVRMPASYCGVYGFKPTYGRVSRFGVVPYANSLDTVGILASLHLGPDMIQQVLKTLDVYDAQDPTSMLPETRHKVEKHYKRVDRPPRIGVPAEYNIQELSPEVLTAWRKCLDRLATKGSDLVPISLPLTKTALAAYYILAPSEVSSNLQKYSGVFYGSRTEIDRLDGRLYASARSLFGDEVKRRILMGCLSLSSERFDNYYLQAQRVRRLIVKEFNTVFRAAHPLLPSGQGDDQVDYIVTPTAPTVAPLLSEVNCMSSAESHAADVFTVPASMAGLPSLSVPFVEDQSGMPIGVQLIGQFGDDYGVLDLSRKLQI
ncbi:putative Glutamyl-tRNA amidotransferase, A subunit [Taphrina deformans PYCC 5710]|uniref:Glutamyl-tRNA(Gln) amidotransferase subunit A, mitochondrial n=1 Tax=Taphrina deformans (strain PYCC 5710 / ATCC 11124 / CBS 356.35 / IMI 108563 / JCM 9778 / NBRC 8474) TaxID=1097556 RepID=R4X792_TAPDE|nr:putative Glutamyl-tRNA amidotransferase, A subunit [Taphrina deformans PYCC 5710]|eukprot:CCG81187.1 putative Glutamyl-tRNA amidotransferase, A subunit [Taphrina deformans PYCC 5710]